MAITKEQTAFIQKVASLITDARILKSVTIAQAILESGWGQSGLTAKANALFGIKATVFWKGKRYSSKTQECYDKVNFTTITAAFRGYNSWTESIADHTNFIVSNSRYKSVLAAKDYKTACYAIANAGYATAPTYAQSLIGIIAGYKLYEYDTPTIAPVKPVVSPTIPKIQIRQGSWNVRKSASLLGKVVKVVSGGQVYTSSKVVNGWYYIDSLGGYIGGKAVTKI